MTDEAEAAATRSNQFLGDTLQERLQSFSSRVLSEHDQDARAWWFTDGPASPAVQGHQVFGRVGGPLRVHLLDLYHGRAPTLVNYTTLCVDPDVQIAFRLFVVLDSNAVSYIRSFFDGQLNGDRREAVREFLDFTLGRGIDPSPVFYLMESIARGDPSRWKEHAAALATAVLDLQTLDSQLFIEEDRLASSLDARSRQLAFHQAEDSGKLVTQYVSTIDRDVVAGEEAQIMRTYAALLKTMLLRSAPGDLGDRLAQLGQFMADRLGAVLGVERFAAILHWAAPERFSRLITPLQKGARADRALVKARSTAWDIYLGRLPEQLGRFIRLHEDQDAEATCNLYYIATGEDALAELIGHRSIELLVQRPDARESSIVVGHRAGVLEELLRPEELAVLSDKSLEWERRISGTAHLRNPVSGAELERVVSELEEEVEEAVKSGF